MPIAKRFASAATPRASLSGPVVREVPTVRRVHQMPHGETTKITVRRRMGKGECDEHMDMGCALTTTPKTHQGGLIRPTDLRVRNWFHGGWHKSIGKAYGSPLEPASSSSLSHLRAFHSSTKSSVGAHSYNDDNKVPDFYQKHKAGKVQHASEAQKESILNREKEESGLMNTLSDSILADSVTASTRRLAAKIPAQFMTEDGELVHASGYTVPKPHQPGEDPIEPWSERRDRDAAAQTAAVAERVLEEDFDFITAETREREGKIPPEIRHQDGSISHASGFIPPTPMGGFKVSMSSETPNLVSKRDVDFGSLENELLGQSEVKSSKSSAKASLGSTKRGYHSYAYLRPTHEAPVRLFGLDDTELLKHIKKLVELEV